MAQRNLTPKDRMVFIGDGGIPETFKQVVCLTSESFNRTTSALEAQTSCGTITEPGVQSIKVDFAGTQVLDPDIPTMSIEELDALWKENVTFNVKMSPAAPQTGDIIRTFTAYFTSLNDTSDFSSNAIPSFTASLNVQFETYEKESFVPTT